MLDRLVLGAHGVGQMRREWQAGRARMAGPVWRMQERWNVTRWEPHVGGT